MVHYFRTHFDFTCHYIDGIIDEWLEFAVSKKVEILELDFETSDKNHDNMFKYDFKLVAGLKKLYLNKVNVSELVLGELLTKSPHLETISIRSSGYLMDIRVGGRDLKLKHFEIVECPFVVSVYLFDFDLESFTYIGRPIDLRLRLPKLKNVQSAKLDSFPGLPNIKKLTLTIVARADNSPLEFASKVNACPNLETFIIEVLKLSPVNDLLNRIITGGNNC
ncbi:hypothetical protein L1987_75893 [Smallanthus sonchifolius]|uniref:Uncharacterized protein n=1 Tax=Smallanthus sonchifolius TaxID=185202 RepID=A0ACB9A7P5_9ASTR|nr:hypothetical protein L1987_75893 [Smallanthus sonchifolius]